MFLLQVDLKQVVAIFVRDKLKDGIKACAVERNPCEDLCFGETVLIRQVPFVSIRLIIPTHQVGSQVNGFQSVQSGRKRRNLCRWTHAPCTIYRRVRSGRDDPQKLVGILEKPLTADSGGSSTLLDMKRHEKGVVGCSDEGECELARDIVVSTRRRC